MSLKSNNYHIKSLNDYLKSGITVNDYYVVIDKALECILKAQLNSVQLNYDINTVKYSNSDIHFESASGSRNLDINKVKSFIKEVAFSAVFEESEKCEDITDFLKFLDDFQRSSNFTNIQEYCKKKVNKDNTYIPNSVGDETGVLDQDYIEKLVKSPIQNSGSLGKNVNEASGIRRGPQLIEKKTGKSILINKENFWIGKSETDLLINSDTISRKHAVIITKNNHYFICDNDSTNKTFVNNKEISPKASVEIFDGTNIKFANNEYVFQIEY